MAYSHRSFTDKYENIDGGRFSHVMRRKKIWQHGWDNKVLSNWSVLRLGIQPKSIMRPLPYCEFEPESDSVEKISTVISRYIKSNRDSDWFLLWHSRKTSVWNIKADVPKSSLEQERRYICFHDTGRAWKQNSTRQNSISNRKIERQKKALDIFMYAPSTKRFSVKFICIWWGLIAFGYRLVWPARRG